MNQFAPAAPPPPPPGDYAKQFPLEPLLDEARVAMRRNGCKTVRFEISQGRLIAHGYIGRFEGQGMEQL